jgi:hypothetical protein
VNALPHAAEVVAFTEIEEAFFRAGEEAAAAASMEAEVETCEEIEAHLIEET